MSSGRAAPGTAAGAPMTSDAVILAGGLGTRLVSVVGDRPKALATIAGRPFLDWQLEYIATQAIDRIVLAVGHLADAIIARYGRRFAGVTLEYARESAPLGTGGAARHAMAQARCDTAYVLNGDTLLPIELHRLEGRPGEDLVIALCEVADVSRFGSVRCDAGSITDFGEKGQTGAGLVNAGVYWMHRRLFDRWKLPARFSLEHDLFAAHAAELLARGVIVDTPFLDIGTPADFQAAQTVLPELLARYSRPRH